MTHPSSSNTDEAWSSSIKIIGSGVGNRTLLNQTSNGGIANDCQSLSAMDKQIVHDSSLSIYERLRHFLFINFVLNKRSFVLSILSYLSDLLLFVSLSIYLFSNKKFMYEETIYQTNQQAFNLNQTTNETSSDPLITIPVINNNQVQSRTIKQSYLTLQIVAIFVFFICFILSYLIKLQFKYHRLAINLYDYDVDSFNNSVGAVATATATPTVLSHNIAHFDRDGRDSLASTTTASHFSSTATNRRVVALLKRLCVRLLTKFASILLHFFLGYQFCQNCFIQQESELYSSADGFTLFTHMFILVCVLFRCLIVFLNKKNTMNKLNHLKKLEQKQKDLFDPANSKNPHRYYYYYYYSYLIKSSQNACNQLKQHEASQNTFRLVKLDEASLYAGFCISLFHLFSFLKAFEILFLLVPILLTLVLFRFKSILNASINLSVLFVSLLIISKWSSFNSIKDISEFYLKSSLSKSLLIDKNDTTTSPSSNLSEPNAQLIITSSIFNLFSYNLFTFLCFLLTFYFKSVLGIYYCSLTSLERWNLSFLSCLSFWRKLSIFVSLLVYFIFLLTCAITICLKYKRWSLLILPFYFLLSFLWCCFELLNTINLTHLMNKISDCCSVMLNEGGNSVANSEQLIRKATTTTNSNLLSESSSNNRNSTLSQSSNSNNNNNNNGGGSFKLTKFLSRFFSYKQLSMNNAQQHHINNESSTNLSSSGSVNIPIHRILAVKGVRHLGSISYRISLYCLAQTVLLSLFTYNTHSPFTIGLYLTVFSINLVWLSLLYQFSKSVSGSCIAYALVVPPLNTLNNQFGTISPNPTLYSSSKKSKTGASLSTTSTTLSNATTNTTTTTTTTTRGSSSILSSFNYQQAIVQRCALILHNIQLFLQFHMIENFACDFASHGLSKESLECRLRSFFQKRNVAESSTAYNTYVLFYCGPTAITTGNLSLADGNEMTIQEIIKYWKEVNCDKEKNLTKIADVTGTEKKSSETNSDEIKHKNSTGPEVKVLLNKQAGMTNSKNNSRLIIIFDSEHTTKSLDYVSTKLIEPGVYIALQTVKYNYNMINEENKNGKCSKSNKPANDKRIAGTQHVGDSNLSTGKFTLDWIKSNFCNSYRNRNVGMGISGVIANMEEMNFAEKMYTFNSNVNREECQQLKEEDEEDEDEDADDSECSEESSSEGDDIDESKQRKKNNNHVSESPATATTTAVFYETKCAFSRYWLEYSFTSSEKNLVHEFNQFWRLYYPYGVCRPLLKLINCRLFYLRFNVFKRILFYLRRLKNKLIPIHEYDTGHGFKLFSS